MSFSVSLAVLDATPHDTVVVVHGPKDPGPGIASLRIGRVTSATMQWSSAAEAREWLTHCLDQLDAIAPAEPAAVTA